MKDQDLYDQFDDFAEGRLNQDVLVAFKKRMEEDASFRAKAEEHVRVVETLKLYGRREVVLNTLREISLPTPVRELTSNTAPNTNRSVRRIWPMMAVAASVALLSIVGTLFMTQSLETKQTAYYKELRRNVEQIKKSQSMIIADIASKEKPAPLPGRYAGTGFLVSGNGYVVTSHHVIKGADSVYIENEFFGRLKTSVVFSDAENDVSVLRIDTSANFKAFRLPFMVNAAEANLGEAVYTLGFPREDVVFGEGSISASSGYRQNPNAYQVSVPVNPGNSGGPLFNSKGDLVGIISGLQTETSGAAFAIKSTVLLDVINEMPLDSLQAPLVLSKQNNLRNLPKVDQVKKWREFVFIVRVYNNK